jgi:hypothetical protein
LKKKKKKKKINIHKSPQTFFKHLSTAMQVIYSPNYISQRASMDEKEVLKLEQAIEVHGYRGASKGKHNGVVPIRSSDTQLWRALNVYYENDTEFVTGHQKRLEIMLTDDSSQPFQVHFLPVKVVAHCPSGNRAVGLLVQKESEPVLLLIMGFANYQRVI